MRHNNWISEQLDIGVDINGGGPVADVEHRVAASLSEHFEYTVAATHNLLCLFGYSGTAGSLEVTTQTFVKAIDALSVDAPHTRTQLVSLAQVTLARRFGSGILAGTRYRPWNWWSNSNTTHTLTEWDQHPITHQLNNNLIGDHDDTIEHATQLIGVAIRGDVDINVLAAIIDGWEGNNTVDQLLAVCASVEQATPTR